MAKYRKYSKDFKLQAAKLGTEQNCFYDRADKKKLDHWLVYQKLDTFSVHKNLQEENMVCCRKLLRFIGWQQRYLQYEQKR